MEEMRFGGRTSTKALAKHRAPTLQERIKHVHAVGARKYNIGQERGGGAQEENGFQLEPKSCVVIDRAGKEEFTCPICLDLLIEPLKLPTCKHILCKRCCTEMIRRNDNQHVKRSCPLCRTVIKKSFDPKSAQIDEDFREKVMKAFPSESKDLRLQVEEGEKYRLPKLCVLYGNTHQRLKTPIKNKRGKKLWECWYTFVKFVHADAPEKRIRNTEFVKKVTFNFVKHYRSCYGVRRVMGKTAHGHFGAGGIGWGFFDYEINIEFIPELKIPPVSFVPELCFENGGITHELELDIDAAQAYLIGLVDRKTLVAHDKRAKGAK